MSEQPIMFPTAANVEPMSDESHEERRSGRDRRETSSAVSDPRLWVSICAILLTICLAVLGVIWSQLARIDANLQAYALKTTQNETEIAQIRREQERLDRQLGLFESRVIVLEKQGTRIEERMRVEGQTAR